MEPLKAGFVRLIGRSFPREHHKFFCRGGIRWPGDGEITVDVLKIHLPAILGEKMISVRIVAESPETSEESSSGGVSRGPRLPALKASTKET